MCGFFFIIINIKMNYKTNIENSINNKLNNTKPIYLNQQNFNKPYIINKSGKYILTENIKLNFFSHLNDLYKYNPIDKFGHAAGIKITCDYVILDLNGFAIFQSPQDYCVQRFFAIIQLNHQPFTVKNNKPVGPISGADYDKLLTANYCIIKNGVLGLTSHQCILGNDNSNIIIENLKLLDFEVSGININNGYNIHFDNININRSIGFKRFTPITPHFASCIFIHKVLQQISNLNISNNDKNILNKTNNNIENHLQPFLEIIYNNNSLTSIYNNFKYCVQNKPKYELFFNKSKMTPCNLHGIKITGKFPSVNQFHTNINVLENDQTFSNKIFIKNSIIKNLHAKIDEEFLLTNDNKILHAVAGLKIPYSLLKYEFIIKLFENINILCKNPIIQNIIKTNLTDDVINFIKYKHINKKITVNNNYFKKSYLTRSAIINCPSKFNNFDGYWNIGLNNNKCETIKNIKIKVSNGEFLIDKVKHCIVNTSPIAYMINDNDFFYLIDMNNKSLTWLSNNGDKIIWTVYKNFSFTSGLDTFGHINKGVIGIRVGKTKNYNCENLDVCNIYNYGKECTNQCMQKIYDEYDIGKIINQVPLGGSADGARGAVPFEGDCATGQMASEAPE